MGESDINKIKEKLVDTVTAFEIGRAGCMDRIYNAIKTGHERFLKTGSGYRYPSKPREIMACEENCDGEYGTDSCNCEPNILVYEYAKQLLEIIKKKGV